MRVDPSGESGLTPQEAVNRFGPKPSDCDIVIVILWSRMGTRLDPAAFGDKPDGEPYLSGTEWEFEDARSAQPRPDILVYRRIEELKVGSKGPERDEKLRQYDLVEEFFLRFENPDGSLRGGWTPYKTPALFKERLASDLRSLLHQHLKRRIAGAEDTRCERLVELQSLLYQTRSGFSSQISLAHQLTTSLRDRNPDGRLWSDPGEFESYFTRMAPTFNQKERELHTLIRQITISILYPYNKAILNWIASNKYFRVDHSDEPVLAELAVLILRLETHLNIWISMYRAWIENNPDPHHAMIYLTHEDRQRGMFPSGIDDLVGRAVEALCKQ